MALPSPALTQAKPTSDKPVAVVNGEAISRTEFEEALARVPLPTANVTETQRKAMRMELLSLMMDERLFQQFLKKNVPTPDPALVQRRIAELETSLKAKRQTLQDYYRDTGQSEVQLRADIVSVIQWNAYVRKKATDEELKRCYAENRELLEGAKVRVSHILLRLPASADAKAKQTVQQRLQAIRQEIERGLDFAEAAKKHSQDSETAANGGDLGYFPPQASDPDPFIRTASSLKVGQMSEVVQTDYGCHLIKMTDRKAGKSTAFEEVREDVRLLWAEELRLKIIAEQRKAAKVIRSADFADDTD